MTLDHCYYYYFFKFRTAAEGKKDIMTCYCLIIPTYESEMGIIGDGIRSKVIKVM